MTDRGPRARKHSDGGERTHRAEARRFLGTPMARSMIRGLDDVERARAYLGVANQLKRDGDVGQVIVDEIVEKLKEAQE